MTDEQIRETPTTKQIYADMKRAGLYHGNSVSNRIALAYYHLNHVLPTLRQMRELEFEGFHPKGGQET